MKIAHRGMFLIPILFVLSVVGVLVAQEGQPITIKGSAIALPVVEKVAQASESPISVALESIGNAQAFSQFCRGEVSLIATSRAMSAQEEADCLSNNLTNYGEYALASNILVFVVNAQQPVTCLTKTELTRIFQPSASGVLTDWSILANTYTAQPLVAYVPTTNTINATLLDDFVNGVGFRSDSFSASSGDIIAQVSTISGTIGVVSYEEARQNADIKILSVDFESGQNGCIVPSPLNVTTGLYPLVDNFFLYSTLPVQESEKALLTLFTSEASAVAIEEQGFTAPLSNAYETNAKILNGEQQGRAFSQTTQTFSIPSDLNGQLAVGGSAVLFTPLSQIVTNFTANQPSLQVTTTFEGEFAGIRRFCNGELDVLVATKSLNDEALTQCQANSITPYEIELGNQVVVLVANQADSFAQCLTTEQIAQLWSANENPVTNWQQIDSAFEDKAITLFGIDAGNSFADLLLKGTTNILRVDTELSADELYRAAAVANVEGAITYMSLSDYQRVLDNNQANIQLVSVKNGDDCELPTSTMYPLVNPVKLVVKSESLTSINLQSLLWTIFSDENFTLFANVNIANLNTAKFAEIRVELLKLYSAVTSQSEAAESTPEATPTTESTPEVTPTAESTPEATPTTESTPEATQSS